MFVDSLVTETKPETETNTKTLSPEIEIPVSSIVPFSKPEIDPNVCGTESLKEETPVSFDSHSKLATRKETYLFPEKRKFR